MARKKFYGKDIWTLCIGSNSFEGRGRKKKKKNRIFPRIPELFERPRVIITLMMFIRDTRGYSKKMFPASDLPDTAICVIPINNRWFCRRNFVSKGSRMKTTMGTNYFEIGFILEDG